MFSFLVTYFNQAEYVKRSLDSILKQKMQSPYEILICDDGSTDGTIEIVREYVKRYPDIMKIFVMQRELKKKYNSVERVSASRKRLLQESKGEFFCFLDGDDFYYDDEFVDKAIDVFSHDNDKEISVVSFNYAIDNGSGRQRPAKGIKKTGIVKKEFYICNFYIHSGACIFRKDYNNYVSGIKKSWQYDDNDIVLYGLKYGEMFHINHTVYAYVQHNDSSYNEMSFVEKSLLNCLGFDTDLSLLPELKNQLVLRYEISIIALYYNKNKILSKVPNEKLEIYNRLSKDYEFSLTNAFLNPNTDNKKIIDYYIKLAWNISKHRYISAYIKMKALSLK